jgi:hypothetical protein
MNDLKILTAQPQPLAIDGETYMVHPLTIEDWGALQAWVDRQFVDPFDVVAKAIEKGKFTVAQQQYMLSEALKESIKPKAPLGSIEADALLMSMDGYTQVLYLSIRKGRPGFTEKDARNLALKLSAADATKLGQVSTLNLVASDPKDEPLNVTPPARKSGSAASLRRTRAAKRTGG